MFLYRQGVLSVISHVYVVHDGVNGIRKPKEASVKGIVSGFQISMVKFDRKVT